MQTPQQLANHKAESKHLSDFNRGVKSNTDGLECPTQQTPVRDGWLFAEEVKQLKRQHLTASREKHLNVID